MEDAHATVLQLDDICWSQWSYFGVFDGHAGARTATKAADELHLHIVSSLNKLARELHDGQLPRNITSSQLDFRRLEATIKDAYFKFDNEWREENQNYDLGR